MIEASMPNPCFAIMVCHGIDDAVFEVTVTLRFAETREKAREWCRENPLVVGDWYEIFKQQYDERHGWLTVGS
jgi:hypothetical protein